MLMWKYGEHKAGLIIPCVISAVTADFNAALIYSLFQPHA